MSLSYNVFSQHHGQPRSVGQPRKKNCRETPARLEVVVLSPEFPSPKTAHFQALLKALDQLGRRYISPCSSSRPQYFSHSPAGSLFDMDVEKAGRDCLCTGVHDDCRNEGFETQERGRSEDETEERKRDRGAVRTAYRIESIL